MLRAGVRQVLDLGCGPGQVAALLYDKGMREYRGLDFSQKAIEIAKSRGVPGFEFQIRDLSQGDFANIPHDCVVTLEFLEHVEFDIPLLSRIKPGTRVFATVPNFPYAGHVRWFDTVEQVAARYASLFSHFTVDAFLGNAKGKTFYLMEGVKL